MMTTAHLYLILHRPTLLDSATWLTAQRGATAELDAAGEVSKASTVGLREALDKRAEHPQPSRRLHGRQSLDGSKWLIEAEFDVADLRAGTIAQYVNAALGAETVTDKDVKVEIMGGIGASWEQSHAAAMARVASERGEWEMGEREVEVSR